jgi:tetraacyldisaccharide 4'-kinase
LPRGPLREGPAALERLRGRGLLWLTRCDLARPGDAQLQALIDRAQELTGREAVRSSFRPAAGAPQLRGRRTLLFAGIGQPASFAALARYLGAEVVGERWFPDHPRFSERELDELQDSAGAAGAELLLTTEKDWVRLPSATSSAPRVAIAALPVELHIDAGEAALEAALDAALAARPA